MSKKSNALTMMPTGSMTGKYLFVDAKKVNNVCRGLRGAKKEFNFKVVMGDRISVTRKDGQEVTEGMVGSLYKTINNILKGD